MEPPYNEHISKGHVQDTPKTGELGIVSEPKEIPKAEKGISEETPSQRKLSAGEKAQQL